MPAIFEVSGFPRRIAISCTVAALLALAPHSSPEARAFPSETEELNAEQQPIYTAPADRALAAEWLGELKADAAYETLIALCTDPDGGVRYSAVEALGKLGDPRATATLARLAADPAQGKVDGARTFSWVEMHAFSGSIFMEEMKPKARIEYDVRRAAQQALLRLRPERAGGPLREPREAIAELAALLKTDLRKQDDEQRAWYLVNLLGEGETGPASAAILVRALEHPAMKSEAASALASRKDRAEVMAAMRPVLARPDLNAQTLAQYLEIVHRHQPAEAPAFARRLVEQMMTADDQAWAGLHGSIGAALRESLRVEDAPVLDWLADQLTAEAPKAKEPPKARVTPRATDVHRATAPATDPAGITLHGVPVIGIKVGDITFGTTTADRIQSSDQRSEESPANRAMSAQAEALARRARERREAVLDLKRSLLDGPAQTEEAARRMRAGEPARPISRSAPELIRLLQEPRNVNSAIDDGKFYQATHELGILKAREAVPSLLTLLDGRSMSGSGGDIAANPQDMAAWALIQIADPASIPELRKWTERSLADFEKKRGTGALLAYGALAGEKAIPALTKILNYPPRLGHPDDEWRMPVTSRMFEPAVSPASVGGRQIWRPQSRAVPSFYWPQGAAACALSRIDSPRAREALRSCLAHADGPQMLNDDVIEAIFHAIPEDLDAWSRQLLATPEGENAWESNSLRETAVAVQLHYFPQKSAALARDILAARAHPLRTSVMRLLRAQPFKDEGVVSALATLLDDPLPEPVKQRRQGFDRRLETIDAMGFQGGPVAVAILLRVAKASAVAGR